jgi:hypothetical protein
MKAPETRKRRLKWSPVAEPLETRQVLSGGAGNTIAIIPTGITDPSKPIDVKFTINPANFTAPSSHKLLLGIAAVANGSTANPQIVSVTDPAGHRISISTYVQGKAIKTSTGAPIIPSVVATFPVGGRGHTTPMTYDLRIKDVGSGTGSVLTGFYLIGDQTGDGKVTQADIAGIKKIKGANVSSSSYDFNADANRDGKITANDVMLAQRNLGASVTILPLITADLSPTNAARTVTTSAVQMVGVASAGATVSYMPAGTSTPVATTTATDTGNYTVTVPLTKGANTFSVMSTDSFGQTISGTISPITYQPLSTS